MLFGLLTYIGEVQNGIENNSLAFYFSVFLAFWSLHFLTSWRRRQNELAFLWGTETHDVFEHARPQFVLLAKNPRVSGVEYRLSHITGKVEPMVVDACGTRTRKVISAITIGICMAGVLLVVVCCQYIKLIPIRGSLYAGKLLGSTLNGVLITWFGYVFERVAAALSEFEHPRTESDFEDSMATKGFCLAFVNNFACLFYLTFARSYPIGAPSLGFPMVNQSCTTIRTSCDNATVHDAWREQCVDGEMEVPSCISDLSFQLAIILVINQVVGGVLEIGIPTSRAKARAMERDGRIKQAQRKMQLDVDDLDIGEVVHAAYVEAETVMTPYETVSADYKELAVQWGNVLMFAVAFPLAPLFAFINNIIEIRADAYKLCHVHRRSEFKTRQDIGAWELVFNTISVVAVITNAALISFVAAQGADMWAEAARYDAVSARISDPKLWLVAGVTEHVVLGLRFILASMISLTPGWVAGAKSTREAQVSRLVTEHEKELKAQQYATWKQAKDEASENEKLEQEKHEMISRGTLSLDTQQLGT